MWCENHGGHEHGPLLDLTSESEDCVLLEALPDVEDILVLERNEPHLLKTSRTRLLYELNHRLWSRRKGRENTFVYHFLQVTSAFFHFTCKSNVAIAKTINKRSHMDKKLCYKSK